MSPKQRATWSYTVGAYGGTVRVYERRPGGLLYLAAWDPTLREGAGDYRRKSLKHRDRKEAQREARRIASILEGGIQAAANPSLGYLVDLYLHHATQKPRTRKWLKQYLQAWVTYLGRAFPMRELGPREWEGWKRLRLEGALDGNGQPVDVEERRPVRPGTVNLGLDALTMLCNWALRWRVDGRPLLDRSPVYRLPYLDDANPQRAIWTHDRYEKILAAAETLTMQVEWHGRRERVSCYLADVLVLEQGTGRRLGAVRQLRYQDLIFGEGPHGKIAWPADTDKTGKAWRTPISLEVRKRLLKIIRDRPGLGAKPLFPSARDPERPVLEETLRRYLRQAETNAGVGRLEHDSFHGLRRKFVTERKHLPDVDVAKAGGWRSIPTMKRAYQQADETGVLEAITEPRRLRDQA